MNNERANNMKVNNMIVNNGALLVFITQTKSSMDFFTFDLKTESVEKQGKKRFASKRSQKLWKNNIKQLKTGSGSGGGWGWAGPAGQPGRCIPPDRIQFLINFYCFCNHFMFFQCFPQCFSNFPPPVRIKDPLPTIKQRFTICQNRCL